MKNETWNLVNSSSNHSVLTDHWVFKLKKNRNDYILKYKAKWIVHNYKQQYELNYEKIFAFVAKSMF